MIKAVIFDIGNVLLKFDYRLAFGRLWPELAERYDELWPAVEEVKNRLERGDITQAEFPEAVRVVLPCAVGDEEFLRIWEDIFEVNEPMIALVKRLRAQYPLYLLSNISQLHVDYLTRTYPFFALFEKAAYSYRIRALKPEPEIYARALAQFGLPAAALIFIDDMSANVAAGRAAGLQAIFYQNTEHAALLAELRALGVDC